MSAPKPKAALQLVLLGVCGAAVLGIAAPRYAIAMADEGEVASPIYGVTIPEGYRSWELIAPAEEAGPLNELRATVGNKKAVEASKSGTLPFPDGTVFVKLAWKHVPSPDFGLASVPGKATTVQVMVKDSKRYAATGGWGFGRFVAGRPVDRAQHETCFACHASRVKDHDYVFTRYAP